MRGVPSDPPYGGNRSPTIGNAESVMDLTFIPLYHLPFVGRMVKV